MESGAGRPRQPVGQQRAPRGRRRYPRRDDRGRRRRSRHHSSDPRRHLIGPERRAPRQVIRTRARGGMAMLGLGGTKEASDGHLTPSTNVRAGSGARRWGGGYKRVRQLGHGRVPRTSWAPQCRLHARHLRWHVCAATPRGCRTPHRSHRYLFELPRGLLVTYETTGRGSGPSTHPESPGGPTDGPRRSHSLPMFCNPFATRPGGLRITRQYCPYEEPLVTSRPKPRKR
jgi:hypothetical protein